MSEEPSFRELIGRVRRGDQQAAAELVRRYEPAIRRAVRFRLTDPRLRRTCDSLDVCQSVLLSFFVRAALGQYDLDTPEQLLRLLTAMARNKLLNQARAQQAARRAGRVVPGGLLDSQLVGKEQDPSKEAEARELLREVQRRLVRRRKHNPRGSDDRIHCAWRDNAHADRASGLVPSAGNDRSARLQSRGCSSFL